MTKKMEDWLASLASELRLEDEDLERFLRRRRKRWKKKRDPNYHAGPVNKYLPLDPSFREECEQVYQDMSEMEEKLFAKREECKKIMMDLELRQRKQELESFHARLAQKKVTSQERRSKLETDRWSPPRHDIVKDLEATCTQMEALSDIRKMKHTMTPKTPALHNRMLSGNIYNQSLGLFHNSLLLESSGDESQSEYSHLHLIGEEISITQEESEGVVPDMYDTVEQASSASFVGCTDVDSDTPGIGMEVICAGGLDKDTENAMSADGRRLLQNLRPDFRFPKQPVTSIISPPSTVPRLPKKRGRPKAVLPSDTPTKVQTPKSISKLSKSMSRSTPTSTPVRKSRRKLNETVI